MKLHFLKTKWSDIIVMEQRGEVALVDTGFAEQFEELKTYLQNMGVERIKFILLTHFHRDHYGCIPALLEEFQVEKVYLKEYSGLDSTTAWGTPADDDYRKSEMDKYLAMQKLITEKSTLIQVENVKEIPFGETVLKLYSTENSIRQIYEDEKCPETYHKILFSENQNSLGVLFTVENSNEMDAMKQRSSVKSIGENEEEHTTQNEEEHTTQNEEKRASQNEEKRASQNPEESVSQNIGKSGERSTIKCVFLGGDMMEHESIHPRAHHVVSQVAREVQKELKQLRELQTSGEKNDIPHIDLYKAPHHGTIHTGTIEALQIFKPQTVVITNEDAYLSEHSDVYANLKAANPEVKIYLTENETVVWDSEAGILIPTK